MIFIIFVLEKQHYEKSDFAIHSGNNSQPMNSLDTTEQHTEGMQCLVWYLTIKLI